MPLLPAVIHAHWTDIGRIVALIADATHTSDLAAWLVPDPQQRLRVLHYALHLQVEHAFMFGEVHLLQDMTGVAVWFYRYRPLPPPAHYQRRLAEACGEYLARFQLLERLVEQQRPTEPHYQLAHLAVAATHQGRGHGTALLAHQHRRLDRVRLPVHTVTTSSGLYQRHGYHPQPPLQIPGGPCLQPMWRPAAQGDTP